MGQINSLQDSEGSPQKLETAGSPDQQNDTEKEKLLETTSKQVRCVKTRIDMLIEDCLNTKDPATDENEKNRTAEVLNVSENEKKKENVNEGMTKDVNGSKKCESEEKMKSESGDSQKGDKEGKDANAVCDEKCEKISQAADNKQNKELKLCDLITDMVQTELTQKQLKQIQQRTITTFNTFIDKVLDNSLTQDNNENVPHKPSNILKLCSESMIPSSERKSEDSCSEVETNDKPECDRDIEKLKTVTLKDHIERFLELSFRDEAIGEEKKTRTKNTNVQENFNAQGLVNSMITQGIQINRMLTTKEQQNTVNKKANVSKDFEGHYTGKQTKTSDQNYKPFSHETHGQKSPSSSNFQDRTDSRSHRAVSSHHSMDGKFRDQYFSGSGNRNSQMPGGYVRRDEMMDRSQEMHTKSSKNEMGMMSNMKYADHMSAFHQPHVLHGANNAYFNSPFGPRMQVSPGQLREKTNSSRGDNKQVVHMPDCMCAMCVHQPHSRHGIIEGAVMDPYAGKRSPNVPHQVLANSMSAQGHPGLVRDLPAMMRPSHSEVPPGISTYQGMHKLLPHHPPITSTKVYSAGQLMVPGDIPSQGMVPIRQLNTPDNQPHTAQYHQRRAEEFSHSAMGNERPNIRYGKQSPYLVRPSSVPSQEHSSSLHTRPGSGHRFYESEYTRSSDSSSCASDCSIEAPLDLSVKKPKIEPVRSRSSSNASAVRKINPSNSFIKHLESSVDKYWQELNSPPSSPAHTGPSANVNRSHSPSDNRNASQMYSQQSPNGSSPSGLLSMLQNRPLPSPHYTGGITVGQPLVDIKPQGTQKQTEYQPSNIQQTGSQAMYQQVQHTSQGRQPNFEMNSKINKLLQEQTQTPYQGNQSNFDVNAKKSGNNVSKHEPIQNIIGNHDPNDILYLICRLCTQTYGSPYGFRKHFRNQHGFEPRAEHTIVQTISATKTALHLPQPQLMQGMPEMHESQMIRKSISPESERNNTNTYQGRKTSSVSPTDTKSLTGSEEGDKTESENTETKCLECPKCGKTFQLNDFGSYKRHCRQHGNVRMNGPFSCTDCHLPFPDQKSLREHYIIHVKDTAAAVVVKQEQKSAGSSQKLESHPTFYVCVKCDKQYDNVDAYKCHLSSHNPESKTNLVELPVPVKSKETMASQKTNTQMSTGIVTSPTVVKQAAESNTSLACPDSSWDNVEKVDATSDKPELISETRESVSSDTTNSSEKSNNLEETKNKTQIVFTPQVSVESGSENEKKSDENEFHYKHKKFFHHRKRASSTQSQSGDASDAKQAKVATELPAATVLDTSYLPVSSSVTQSVNSSCDSTGTVEGSVLDTVKNENVKVKLPEKVPEKPVKTEARHSLPFVWDRTTRSQKKL